MDINMKLNTNVKQEQKASVLEAKKTYTIIGLALLALVGITIALQYAAGAIFSHITMSEAAQTWYLWLATFAPMYLCAIPAAIFIMRKLSVEKSAKEKLGFSKYVLFFVMSVSLFYVGNILGTVAGSLFTGGVEKNGLLSYSMQNNMFKVLFLVVFAPIIEEYLFRKQIIDRCVRFGEAQAILFSGLTFAIFHMNIYQFFYALGVGLLFAYIYVRTRNVKITMSLHIILNSMGSIIAPWIMSQLDMAAVNKIASGYEMPNLQGASGIIVYAVYAVTLFLITSFGIILMIVKRKQFVITKKDNQLEKGESFKAIYLNPGFILFAAICLVFTVLALL